MDRPQPAAYSQPRGVGRRYSRRRRREGRIGAAVGQAAALAVEQVDRALRPLAELGPVRVVRERERRGESVWHHAAATLRVFWGTLLARAA